MKSRSRILGLLLSFFLLTGCSAADDAPTTTSSDVSATTTSPRITTTTGAITTTGPDATTSTSLRIEVEYRDGQFTGANRYLVQLGEVFDIWLLADVVDEVHVHGYDLFYEVEPGVPVNIMFAAGVPGIFEVELESSHALLFEIEVIG